jgi:hypothetical protein
VTLPAGYPDYGLAFQGQISALQLYGNLTSAHETAELLFYDWTLSAIEAVLGVAEAAGQIVSGSLLLDLILFASAGRVLLQAGSSGPQIILDSGGARLPIIETYNALTTAGQGVAVVVAAAFFGPLSGSSSYGETLLASAPAGIYRVSAHLLETSAAGSGNMSVTTSYRENSGTLTSTVAPAVATGTLNAHTEGSQFIRSDATASITLTATTNNTSATFYLWAVLERLS